MWYHISYLAERDIWHWHCEHQPSNHSTIKIEDIFAANMEKFNMTFDT